MATRDRTKKSWSSSGTAVTCVWKESDAQSILRGEIRRLGQLSGRIPARGQAQRVGKCEGERMLQWSGIRRRIPCKHSAGHSA